MMTKKEFYEVVDRLLDQYGAEGCAHCPYAEQCEARELYWGLWCMGRTDG